MVFKSTIAALAISATAATAQQEEAVPEDFLGGSTNPGETQSNRTSELPVFPILGNASSDVTVDYFYAYDCDDCPAASTEVRKVLEENLGVDIVFHPLSRTQDDYDAAIAETIAFSISPGLFQYVHFGSMIGKENEDDFDYDRYLRDVVSMSERPDAFWTRVESYEDWTTSIDLNTRMAAHFGAENLPFFVIDGVMYEGVPEAGALKTQILVSKGKQLEESMSGSEN